MKEKEMASPQPLGLPSRAFAYPTLNSLLSGRFPALNCRGHSPTPTLQINTSAGSSRLPTSCLCLCRRLANPPPSSREDMWAQQGSAVALCPTVVPLHVWLSDWIVGSCVSQHCMFLPLNEKLNK